jgi:hypothetical protein
MEPGTEWHERAEQVTKLLLDFLRRNYPIKVAQIQKMSPPPTRFGDMFGKDCHQKARLPCRLLAPRALLRSRAQAPNGCDDQRCQLPVVEATSPARGPCRYTEVLWTFISIPAVSA